MTRQLLSLTIACLFLSIFFTSCHTGQEYIAHKSTRQPKFIGDIYLPPHNRTTSTSTAIDAKKTRVTNTQQTESKAVVQEDAYVVRESAAKGPRIISVTYSAPKSNPPAEKCEKEETPAVCNKYAEMLGVAPEKIANPSLYQFIERWYGANYRLGGVDSTGIDCSGFAQKLYTEIYGFDLDRTAKEQFSSCMRLKHAKEAREGDLVFFHVHSRRITHVGVYLANDYFVHASSSQGVVISNLKDEYWHKFFAGCGRIRRSEIAKN